MIGKAPQKGKAFDKLPVSISKVFDSTLYLASIKYDGNQVFIVKEADRIHMYSSDWKEFHNKAISKELLSLKGSFILIGEYLHDCKGLLGDRGKSAILTTFRTNFSKGLPNSVVEEAKATVMVFDYIHMNSRLIEDVLHSVPVTNTPATDRLDKARFTLRGLKHCQVIDTVGILGREAKTYAHTLALKGYEGAMLIEPNSTYHIGKRVNHAIKLKHRKTVDLKCIGTQPGEGKYEGMIGALVLQDAKGRKVSVGSGLDDTQRSLPDSYYTGKIIEIEYEQILDTYIQPVFKAVREDKKVSD